MRRQRVEPQPFFAALIPGGLAACKTLASTGLGLIRASPISQAFVVQENPPAFEVRDQAALDWQREICGAPCTVWPKT